MEPVPAWINQLKANYYSSITRISENMRVRDWLNGQSFEFQMAFGRQTLFDLMNGIPLP